GVGEAGGAGGEAIGEAGEGTGDGADDGGERGGEDGDEQSDEEGFAEADQGDDVQVSAAAVGSEPVACGGWLQEACVVAFGEAPWCGERAEPGEQGEQDQ